MNLVKKENPVLVTLKEGGTLEQALQLKKQVLSGTCFYSWVLSLFPIIILAQALPALTGMSELWSGITGCSMIISSLVLCNEYERKYDVKKLLAKLSEEERTLCLSLNEKNMRETNLLKEYQENHQAFMTKYFGYYSTELSMMVKHEVEMDKTDNYLSSILNEESEAGKALRAKINVLNKTNPKV